MEKNTFSQELEVFLEKQLERTNFWLSFAEAKNAALLAFNIAILAFVVGFQKDFPILSTLSMIVFIFSSLICLWSFYPKEPKCPIVDTKRKKDNKKENKLNNFLYWKTIAHIETTEKFIDKVVVRYFPDQTVDGIKSELYNDLAQEIIDNSRVAKSKYELFSLAIRIDFLAFFLSIILLIVA